MAVVSNPKDIVANNLRMLYECCSVKERYRICYGRTVDGKKVVVVKKATSFLDKLISYCPSGCILRKRFSKAILESLAHDRATRAWSAIFIRFNIPIPFLSINQWRDVYNMHTVYNPWSIAASCLDEEKYSVSGSDISREDIESGKAIVFFDVGYFSDIFSNFSKKDGVPLCVIDTPGSTFTSSFPEIIYQSWKCSASPELQKTILALDDPISACTLAHTNSSEVGNRVFNAGRSLKFLLKIVRTRAQQDFEFRQRLVATQDKNIFMLSDSDTWLGCVLHASQVTKFYCGTNLMGRILMQVRDECKVGYILRRSTEDIEGSRGFCVGIDDM